MQPSSLDLAQPSTLPAATSTSLQNLPVNLFGAVMGLSGLALAWKMAQGYLGVAALVSDIIGVIAMLVFIILSAAYLGKLILHPNAVLAEFQHPVAGHFFATIAISILLLSVLITAYSPLLSQLMWTIGSITTFILSFLGLHKLLNGGAEPGHALPAWLISGVATLDIAVTGGTMPTSWAQEMNLAALAVGSVLALIFYVLIISRLIHQPALASRLKPSLMILVAPFAVGFLAYVNIFHRIDAIAALLFYFGLFTFLVVCPRVFRRENTFHPGWWAISFPMAALANAALRYSAAHHSPVLVCIAIGLLALVTLAILSLSYRTLHMVFNGTLLKA